MSSHIEAESYVLKKISGDIFKCISLKINSPCGCGDLSDRLGSRMSPHPHRVVVEVHWHGAQGWRPISWVVATFNHVDGSFNLSMAATGGMSE